MPPRTCKLNSAFVAFLDVLGYRERLSAVKNDADLTKLYGDMRTVHRLFDKDPRDALEQRNQRMMKKRIVSLSDALVVSFEYSDRELRDSAEWVDIVASELSNLAMSQGNAVARGIFIRGGISEGYFCLRKDVLMSDALVRAYKIETEEAVYPVIVLDDRLTQRFCSDHANRCYAPEWAPHKDLLSPHPTTGRDGRKRFFLDYLAVMFDACAEWHSPHDHKAYMDAKDPDTKQAILSASYRKNQVGYFVRHAAVIRKELHRKHPPSVHEKYVWLRTYHNSTVTRLGVDTIGDPAEVTIE